MPIILAIESSCDETGASVCRNGEILSNIVATQAIHQQYGGVVPELASRAHHQHIVPAVGEALKKAGVDKKQLDAIAFTQGPGLLGALLVGMSFAKAMSFALNIPLIGVHHMKAHVLSHFIEAPKPQFPFICLTVSGGHTQVIIVHSASYMEVVGETQDDAVGEAFDKTAKLLGLPYPGGPLVDKYAQQGNPLAFQFPEVSTEGLNFSFSGIKTALLYFLRDNTAQNPNFVPDNLADICASMQHQLVKILMQKLKKASKQYDIRRIGIAGGVSANSGLRKAVAETGEKLGWEVFIPKMEYCTDNAAMIAIAANFLYAENKFVPLHAAPLPRMPFVG